MAKTKKKLSVEQILEQIALQEIGDKVEIGNKTSALIAQDEAAAQEIIVQAQKTIDTIRNVSK